MVPLITCVSFELIKYAWIAWMRNEVSGESGWNPLIWPVRSAIAFGFIMFSAQLISETIKTGSKLLFPNLKKTSS